MYKRQVRDFLQELYQKFPGIQVLSSASTGYGEEIIKNAFGLDMGVVETIAHFTADVYKRQAPSRALPTPRPCSRASSRASSHWSPSGW